MHRGPCEIHCDECLYDDEPERKLIENRRRLFCFEDVNEGKLGLGI